MVSETIEVVVTRLKVRLLKVSFPGGHHLVVGGRLVSSAEDGVVTPHPDLPPYRVEDFPVDFVKWSDGEIPDVSVTVRNGAEMKPVGCVRAGTLLFTERDARTVTAWIRSQS